MAALGTSRCAGIESVLHRHFSSPNQRRGPGVRTLVAHGGTSGLGDHTAGLLGSIALAMASGRRLEIGAEDSSVLGAGFVSPYDLAYTGSPELNAVVDEALLAMVRVRAACKANNGSYPGSCVAHMCCGGKSHYVPRPLEWPPIAANASREVLEQVAITWGCAPPPAHAQPPAVECSRACSPVPRRAADGKHHEITGAIDRKGRGLLTKPVEMVILGNSGGSVFRHYFHGQRLNGTATADSAGCALRFLLRPSPAAALARERIRPAFWPPRWRAGGR